jgi:hypothetical protein
MVAVIVTAGMSFVSAHGTAGGAWVDVPFLLFGVGFATLAGLTVVTARAREFAAHTRWATRLFALAVSSAVYRVLVLPLFVAPRGPAGSSDNLLPRADEILWLNIAAWLYAPISLVPAELYL